MKKNRKLKKRILDISYKHGLSHIGSCITAVGIIEDIYKNRKEGDKFVLSAGHAGLALYTVLEKHGLNEGMSAEEMFLKGGIHPDRLTQPVDVSTGSLGHGLPISIGLAIANPKIDVYCLISDGEFFEGSIFESLNFLNRYNVPNLYIKMNINGYTGYKDLYKYSELSHIVSLLELYKVEPVFTLEELEPFPFLDGLKAHYHVMSDKDYKIALSNLGYEAKT